MNDSLECINWEKEILGNDKTSFLNIFKVIWNKHLQSFPRRYRKGEQFLIGARYRPVILCWGYALSGNSFNIKKRSEVAQFAVHIELLHKSTLLIDDLIDNDSLRHGKKAFHVQYTANEAILFAYYLLGDSFQQITNSLKDSQIKLEYYNIVNLFCETIKEMASGALKEMNLSSKQFTSLKVIKEIIENQTISLIKNSLLIGYKFGNGDINLIKIVDNIGYDCGYIFQLLNDLEPFGSAAINVGHKGKNNIDILRSRKNLTVAFIFNSLNYKKRSSFEELINSSEREKEALNKVFEYYHKNNVLESILINLKNVRSNIDRNLNELESNIGNKNLLSSFKGFINFLLIEAIKRVGKDYHNKLSDILIR